MYRLYQMHAEQNISYAEMGFHIGDGVTVLSWVIDNHMLIEKYLAEFRREKQIRENAKGKKKPQYKRPRRRRYGRRR